MTIKTLDIDTTKPADGVQPDKSEFRSKWTEIKTKYESLAGQAMRYRGAWVLGAYLSGDVVLHLDSMWYASAGITTEVPGTDSEWVPLSFVGGPNGGLDGRTILEAGSITDASAEFLSGATFTLDPTNARHYNIQVGDSTTPLTAAMTIDLVPDSTLWPDTAQLIITKGSSDAYNITLSGLNADGLGTVTLVDQYEGVILGYHHTDGANGPGAAGQKWKIVARFTRARRTDVQSVIDAGGYLQRGDVFPEPGLVESVAGAFVLDWETDFDGPRLVKLVRAAGDVSESLLVTLPEIPSGDWATVLVTEPMTVVAPNRTFSIAASWEDVLGVGTFTITESGVTTATLGLAAGDVVSGGPFGSPTTISEIVSAAVFKTVAAAGETDSGMVSIVAPAYSIDGNRQINSPTLGNAGAVMQFTVISEPTATTRGEIISAERPGGVGVVSTVVETVEATPTVVNDVMLITDAHLATQMTVTEGEVTLTETFVKLVNSDPSTAMQVRLAFGTASSTRRVVLLCDPSQTGEVTIVSADDGEDPAGTVDGVAAIVAPSSGAVLVRRKLGETKNYVTSVDDTPIFRGVVTLQGGVRETATPASATGAVEIDLAGGGIRILTMTGNVTALTFANRPPDGEAATISVYWTQDGSGSHTLAAPSGVRYPGGTAPTLVTTAAAVNLVTYIVHGQSGAVDLLAQPGMAAP